MTTPMEDNRPVPVEIKNWTDQTVKPRFVKKTTTTTYIIDPAGTAGPRQVQITDYEPQRVRTVIQVIDVAITLTTEVPRSSPDTSVAAGPAPQGRYLPASTNMEYVFLGPDAFWLNSLTAVTRVTVTREYC